MSPLRTTAPAAIRLLTFLTAIPAFAAPASGGTVTFYKDVLPVLQKNCQNCHRPGEAAPMSLLTYKDTRPWAKAIAEAVSSRKMPPWFADPAVGHFTNDRSLSKTDLATLTLWAGSGAREGSPAEAPPPVQFTTGWAIGKPDAVFEIPEEFEVQPTGTVEYTYAIVPTGFTQDRWVSLAEARPGNRAVVHHIIAFVREPGSKWLCQYPAGKMFVPNKKGEGGMGEFVTGYAPGLPPEQLRAGQAKLIKAGSDIVFQMHYTVNGKPAKDRSKVGLVFATQPPAYRVLTLAASTNKFTIPAGAPDYPVSAEFTLHADSELLGLLPHMHLRGKSMEMRAVYPDGTTEKLLWVPRYDFNWQLWYQLPTGKMLPKGTRIQATGSFDNSANNRNNPDPSKPVSWGEQSWEEMMMGFFNVAIPVSMNPTDLFRAPKKPATPTSTGAAE